MLRSVSLLTACGLVAAQFDTLCQQATATGTSSWNETRCDSATSTCCGAQFSVSGAGCCPFKDAVCCPNGSACCPKDTTCKAVNGSSFSTWYDCVPNGSGPTDMYKIVCKPGPALPNDPNRKNILWIGDSLSIGQLPILANRVSDWALAQHAPWDTHDGGAEETAYGLQCLDWFLRSPSGIALSNYDLVMFNWGMHDGPMGNSTVPGQNAPPDMYSKELAEITDKLVQFAKASTNTQLLYVSTTPYMCSVNGTGCVENLNNQAAAIMADRGIPMVSSFDAIINECGPPPQTNCFNFTNCFCPHCTNSQGAPGYDFVIDNVILPVVKKMLGQ